MIVKLLTENHLEFLILKECCRGSTESKMSKCQIVGNLMPWFNFFLKVLLCQQMYSTESKVMFQNVD